MRTQLKKLLICLAIPLAVGGLAALAAGGFSDYAMLDKPPLAPPGWVFPVVWTVLYLLMGYASFLVLESGAEPEQIRNALILYGVQLAANFVWPVLFFRFDLRLTALLWLGILWVLVFATIRLFSRISERSGDLLVPYILWISFAAYLNMGTFLLN